MYSLQPRYKLVVVRSRQVNLVEDRDDLQVIFHRQVQVGEGSGLGDAFGLSAPVDGGQGVAELRDRGLTLADANELVRGLLQATINCGLGG